MLRKSNRIMRCRVHMCSDGGVNLCVGGGVNLHTTQHATIGAVTAWKRSEEPIDRNLPCVVVEAWP